MSACCMSTYMCEVWRPPPLPNITGVDLKKIYATDEAYNNYTRLCPGYAYIDGPDISKSTTVASAGLAAWVIILIVIGLVVVVIIVSCVACKCYAKKLHPSSTQPFNVYKDINYLDNKACKGIYWKGTNATTRRSPIETSLTNSNSNGANGQVVSPHAEISTAAVYSKGQENVGKGQRENAATGESNKSRERHGRKKSKRASENGGEKDRDETASIKSKNYDNVERALTPVENAERDEIGAYNILNSNKNNVPVNTPPSSNIYDVLRHSEGVNGNRLPPLDGQSVKHRNSDSQVISPKKKKKKGLLQKSAPVPTHHQDNMHI